MKIRFKLDAQDAIIDAESTEDLLLTLAEYFEDMADGLDPANPFIGGLFVISQARTLH